MSAHGIEIASSRASAPLRLSALGTSLVGHALLGVALLIAFRAAPPANRVLTRLVFVDAPPPPPPAATVAVAEPVPPKPRPVEKRVGAKKRPAPAAPATDVAKAPEVAPSPAPAVEEPSSPVPSAAGSEGGLPGGIAGGTGAAPVPAGQVARPPVLVHRVVPTYPPAAKRRGVTGMVRLEAILDVRGRVEESIRVLQSIPELDDAATEALRQWRFAPARNDAGEPVRVVLEVPIRFVLH